MGGQSLTDTKNTTMAKNDPKYNNLFEKLYNDGPEALKAGDQSLVLRQLKRQWEAAHDNAEGELLSNKLKINSEYGKLKLCNINTVIELMKENDDLASSMECIELAYEELFGEAFPTAAEQAAG